MKKFLLISFLLATALVHDGFAQKRFLSPFQPVLIRGPYLQVGGPTTMTIRWRTDVFDRSRVKFGLSPDQLTQVQDDSTLVTDHIVTLSNLQPLTKYYYSIGAFEDTVLQSGPDNYFYTLPEDNSEGLIRLAGFGDCGNSSPNQYKVRDAVLQYAQEHPLNGWFLIGDNAYSHGRDIEYQHRFFNVYKNDLLKHYPLYPVPGNHDYYDERWGTQADRSKIAYFQNFTVPTKGELGGLPSGTPAYYSYDIGNVHFLALDSYAEDKEGKYMYDEQVGAQVKWVREDLKANKKKWVVAYWHHPPYTKGSHDSDKENDLIKIRENFLKHIEEFGVDLVICGHSHVYERTRLIKGHYGMEAEFDAKKHEISHSSGRNDQSPQSEPYVKTNKKNQGTVYVVSGSAGSLGGKKETYPHDAMVYSNHEVGGAVILEVKGDQLQLKWLTTEGKIADQFTMLKK